ncbi:hypothetical protein JKP88DRAFT_240991 [Tribonema minus]|uniref:Uncharacterized protein n=1 Tax=Tribonema minus TaxID=303371 RepID=A0A836CHQ1_9STRA|nr:hypothetical protein JKP88DRAFT_240991 [Tribonema minus]
MKQTMCSSLTPADASGDQGDADPTRAAAACCKSFVSLLQIARAFALINRSTICSSIRCDVAAAIAAVPPLPFGVRVIPTSTFRRVTEGANRAARMQQHHMSQTVTWIGQQVPVQCPMMSQMDTEMTPPPPPPFHHFQPPLPPAALPPLPPPPPATFPPPPPPPSPTNAPPPPAAMPPLPAMPSLPPAPISAMRQFQDRIEQTIDQTYTQTPEQQQEVNRALSDLHGVINLHVSQLHQSIGHLIETPIKVLLEKNTLLRAGNTAHHELIQFHQRLMDSAISKRDDAICDLRVKLDKTQDDLILVSGDLCQRNEELLQLKQSITRLGDALRTCEDQVEDAYVRLERREQQLENTTDSMRLSNIKLDDALESLRQCDTTITGLRGELKQKCEENAMLKERLLTNNNPDAHLPWLNHDNDGSSEEDAGAALIELSRGDKVAAKRACVEYSWITVDGEAGSLGRHVDGNDLVRVLVLSPFDTPVPLTLEEAEEYVSTNSFVYGVPLECGIVFHLFLKDPSKTYSRVPLGAAWNSIFDKYLELAAIKDRVRVHVCNSNVNTLTLPSMKNGDIKFKTRKGLYNNMGCVVAAFNNKSL